MVLLFVLGGLSGVLLWAWSPDLPRDVLIERYGQPPSTFVDVGGTRVHLRDQDVGRQVGRIGPQQDAGQAAQQEEQDQRQVPPARVLLLSAAATVRHDRSLGPRAASRPADRDCAA